MVGDNGGLDRIALDVCGPGMVMEGSSSNGGSQGFIPIAGLTEGLFTGLPRKAPR